MQNRSRLRKLLGTGLGAQILGILLMLPTFAGYARDSDSGQPARYIDPSQAGPVNGLGIEQQDIVAMTDQMVKGMLASPGWMDRKTAPRIIIDAEYFKNEEAARTNKRLITSRLRISLNKAARNRLVFVGRHFADMVEKERALKAADVVDKGTIKRERAVAAGDFRLGGSMPTLDSVNNDGVM